MLNRKMPFGNISSSNACSHGLKCLLGISFLVIGYWAAWAFYPRCARPNATTVQRHAGNYWKYLDYRHKPAESCGPSENPGPAPHLDNLEPHSHQCVASYQNRSVGARRLLTMGVDFRIALLCSDYLNNHSIMVLMAPTCHLFLILKRLQISPTQWIYLSTQFDGRFKGIVGTAESLKRCWKQFALVRRQKLKTSLKLFCWR